MSRDRLALATLAAVVACHHPTNTAVVPPPPSLPPTQLSTPSPRGGSSETVTLTTIIGEERVDVDTHGRDADARDILTFLGQRAGLQFVFSPEINKKVRLTLIDVPVSVAIAAVLDLARLTLQPLSDALRTPPKPAIVFYQLPANVDSLSAGAIVKRFGVAPGVAEMIIEARTRRP